jgi:hypothetical protein
MSVTPDAATVARDVQPANAFAPIAVHAVGSVTDFSAVQPANADSGISVMDVDERLMLVSVVHPASAPSAISVTVDATVTDVGLSKPMTTPSRIINPDVVVEEARKVSNVQVADEPPPG